MASTNLGENWAVNSLATWRFTALSSTSSILMPRRLRVFASAAASRGGGRSSPGAGASALTRLGEEGQREGRAKARLESTVTSPPMRRASWRVIASAEARTAETARDRGVGLREGREQLVRVASFMPMPVSTTPTEISQQPGCVSLAPTFIFTTAALGELDGVGEQVAHALAHAHRIVVQALRQVRSRSSR